MFVLSSATRAVMSARLARIAAIQRSRSAVAYEGIARKLAQSLKYQDRTDLAQFRYEDLARPEWRGKVCLRSAQHPYNTAVIAAYIAHHGEAAAETWTGEWWTMGGGGTAWDSFAYDPDAGLLYVGTGNGSPWDRNTRSPDGGDNLFISSILALDVDTGELAWHYQTTPGDTWDYTAVQQLTLAELTLDGRERKVIMQAPKNGFFYVHDRATGQLLAADKFVEANWASGVDLANATGQASSTEANIPSLQAAYAAAVHRLSVLTGRPPAALKEPLAVAAPIPAPSLPLPTGVPAEVLRIAGAVDVERGGEQLWIEPIHHANATELSQRLGEIFPVEKVKPGQPPPPAPGKPGSFATGKGDFRVQNLLPDERTNSLVIVATESAYLRILELIRHLDVPLDGEGGIHVHYLQHGDAEDGDEADDGGGAQVQSGDPERRHAANQCERHIHHDQGGMPGIAERGIEKEEDGHDGERHEQGEPLQRGLLVLVLSAPFDPVPLGHIDVGGNPVGGIGNEAADIPAPDVRADDDQPLPTFVCERLGNLHGFERRHGAERHERSATGRDR